MDISLKSSNSTICDICFYPQTKDDMFDILCCKNNFMCKACHKKLNCNECPYCRQEYEGEDAATKTSRRNRRRSNTISTTSSTSVDSFSFLDLSSFESFDDISTTAFYSRIYRRKRNRIIKMREQEENRKRNRELRILRINESQNEKRREKKKNGHKKTE